MYNKKTILFSFYLICLTFIAVSAQTDLRELDRLIQQAQENNAELRAGFNRWKSAESRIGQAGAMPDPVLGLNLMNLPVDSYEFNQEPMTGKQISLMQKFPFPGKLGLAQKIAEDMAKIEHLKFQQLQLEIEKQVEVQYYELFYVNKAIEIVQRNISLMNQSGKIAEMRYKTGKGLQQDVLSLNVEISKLEEKIIRLKQARQEIIFQLNKTLNRELNTPIEASEILSDSLVLKNSSALKTIASEQNPLLLAWRTRAEQSERHAMLARKSYLPDLTIGLAYTQRDELLNGSGSTDYLSGSVSLNLPIHFRNKQKKEVEELEYKNISAREDYANVKLQIEASIESKYSEILRNHRLKKLYRERILPEARQALQSILGAYQVNKTDFLTLLDGYKTLYTYELDSFRVLTDYQKNLAELEALVGR